MLREFRALRDLSAFHHVNIVKLEEVIRETNQNLYFVFEFMPDGNLYEFIKHYSQSKSTSTFSAFTTTQTIIETKIRSIAQQILRGLAFLHDRGYIHRDIKPENILMHGNICKLADFGLARESSCQNAVTDYVSTRWYRAPEVLLRSPAYGKPLDLFGVGCVIAELYGLKPLFPGTNEIDQIYLITQMLGTPDTCWKEGCRLANKLGVKFNCEKPTSLRAELPDAPPVAIHFMTQLLHWNPEERPTCDQALLNEYFVDDSNPSLVATSPLTSKRRTMVSVSPNDDGALLKRRRLDGSPSPRSIERIFDLAWNYSSLPYCQHGGDSPTFSVSDYA